MPLYTVRRFRDGRPSDELTTIKAENDLAAAEVACGERLRYSGESTRLRAQVTFASNGSALARCFFAQEDSELVAPKAGTLKA